MTSNLPWLTLLTITPLLGGLVALVLGRTSRGAAFVAAMGSAVLSVGVVFGLCAGFDGSLGTIQFAERHAWIPGLGVEYFLGVDGLGLLMVLLTGLLVPMALMSSRGIAKRPQIYWALMLFLQAGLFGTFTALNFFHWFLFWELSLIPAFFLIRGWGGPARVSAAFQFFVFTMVGSVAMLLAFLAIYAATGSFDFLRLAELASAGQLNAALRSQFQPVTGLAEEMPVVVFIGVLLGFAVKVPLMPFHSWLPAAYSEAPTSTTMLLTGLMSKMGVYGFLRIVLPLFPKEMQVLLTPLLWLTVLTIVFSAWAALAQRDLRRMLAYSSMNHLGYCLLGIFAAARASGNDLAAVDQKSAALAGVILQMFNHGLTAAALFCFLGFLEQRSGGLRGVDDFGGLRKVAPVFCGLMGIALFSSLGLPGLNGFVGEFLIFRGAFPLATWAACLSTVGLLVTAIFILSLLQKVFNGPLNERWAGMADLSSTERWIVAPAIGLMFWLGIYPQSLLGLVNATVARLVGQLTF